MSNPKDPEKMAFFFGNNFDPNSIEEFKSESEENLNEEVSLNVKLNLLGVHCLINEEIAKENKVSIEEVIQRQIDLGCAIYMCEVDNNYSELEKIFGLTKYEGADNIFHQR